MRSVAIVLLLGALQACGAGSPRGDPLLPEWQAVYEEAVQRTGVSAPAPLMIIDATIPCKDDPEYTCLASEPGLGGVYYGSTNTVVIPALENLAVQRNIALHEFGHHLSHHVGLAWKKHCNWIFTILDPGACPFNER